MKKHQSTPVSSIAPKTIISVQPAPSAMPVEADRSPGLSPEQIPQVESGDREIPNDLEAADALGIDAHELHDEILNEELQLHPTAHGDEEDMKSLKGVADELHRRLSGNPSR